MTRGRARCCVLVGGLVGSHKGVNLPGVPLPIPSMTRKDFSDLHFALELGGRLRRAVVRARGGRRARRCAS